MHYSSPRFQPLESQPGFYSQQINFNEEEEMGKGFLLSAFIALTMLIGTPVLAQKQEDIMAHPECKYCGMYRKPLAHSRMVVSYRDGTTVGVCSLNCAAIAYVKRVDDSPETLKVGDYKTKKLIDAQKAQWVIGGSKQGVMTKRAKWAFKKRRDAESFIKKHGGQFATFDEVMKASYEDIYEDMRELEELKEEYARSKRTESRDHRLNWSR
jgi:nitrous oxide reductase accessory protein NosL